MLLLFFSPSDLEADLEDNQDYDSTVSQSETNLTIIGQSSLSGSQNNSSNSCKPRLRCSEHSSHYVYSSQRDDSGGLRGGFSARYRERDWDHGNEFDTIRPTYSIRARREQKELDEAGGAASILSENAKAAAKARELEQVCFIDIYIEQVVWKCNILLSKYVTCSYLDACDANHSIWQS